MNAKGTKPDRTVTGLKPEPGAGSLISSRSDRPPRLPREIGGRIEPGVEEA